MGNVFKGFIGVHTIFFFFFREHGVSNFVHELTRELLYGICVVWQVCELGTPNVLYIYRDKSSDACGVLTIF